jgi:hypothetical protein
MTVTPATYHGPDFYSYVLVRIMNTSYIPVELGALISDTSHCHHCHLHI